RFVRDLMRTRFHLQGQIALVTCNTGAIATFAHDLSMVFNTRVLAFRKKVLYDCKVANGNIIKRGVTKYDPDLVEQKSISDGDAAWEPEPEPEVKKSPEEDGFFPGYMIHAVTKHWVSSESWGEHLKFDRAVPKPASLGPVLYSHVEPTQLRLQVLGGRRGVFEVEVNVVDEQGNPPTVYDEDGRVEVVLGGEYDPASGQGVELLGESQWRFEAKNRGHHSLKARAHRIPSFQLRAT